MADTTLKDRAQAISKKLRLDNHHSAERFGIMISALGVSGVLLLGATGSSAYMSEKAEIADQTVYTSTFTTSKTGLSGEIDGVYGNQAGDKVLVMMKFDERSPISHNAEDYQAFLMGAGMDMSFQELETEGLQGSFHVMGSTGYVGVLLEADEPFAQQVMNLTMRANTELTRPDTGESGAPEELSDEETALRGGDSSFDQYDQWRVFINPGAEGVEEIPSMEQAEFDPAEAYYDIVVKDQEEEIRSKLDTQLDLMRADLERVNAYSGDLATTKVDGLFLRPPSVPDYIKGDEVVGASAQESENDESSLQLRTDAVTAGGFDFDWRSGNVRDGYLKDLVPEGKSVSEYLNERNESAGQQQSSSESADGPGAVSQMTWELSDGSSLTDDYDSSARSMQPLVTAMNNLSGAYESYATDKSTYQTDLLPELLALDVDMRGVESNASVNDDEGFLTY